MLYAVSHPAARLEKRKYSFLKRHEKRVRQLDSLPVSLWKEEETERVWERKGGMPSILISEEFTLLFVIILCSVCALHTITLLLEEEGRI